MERGTRRSVDYERDEDGGGERRSSFCVPFRKINRGLERVSTRRDTKRSVASWGRKGGRDDLDTREYC